MAMPAKILPHQSFEPVASNGTFIDPFGHGNAQPGFDSIEAGLGV